ncbi:class I SAM-dependent rRNA methyltransferase, partial [Prevotella aurantiaca]
MYKKIVLKKGKEESLLRKHPWVFSGAILKLDETLEEGELVQVYTHNGNFIGVGHFQIGSITVRILSFSDVPIDADFWQSRLKAAWAVREAIGVIRPEGDGASTTGETVNTTYRLVHGEGDNLPGLIVDVYGTTCVLQAHSVGMHVSRFAIADALRAVMGEKIDSIYYKSETTLPYKAELGQENGFLYGDTDNNIAIENGLKFHIDWLRGQKTGFFIDQRENRSLLEYYAKGRSVLNMFCYTGGFSVYAMRGGAKMVHSVDSSAKAVELTNENIALNFPGDNRHAAICEDAFKYLDDNDGKYDLIVLDPPAFAKHRSALKNGLRGYTR